MAGISAQQCVSLILSNIGGIPLQGAATTTIEGSPPAKQIGGAAFSIPGMDMLQGAFNGLSADSLTSTLFNNPIATAATSLAATASSAVSNLENTFVTMVPSGIIDPITGLEGEMRAIKTEFADKMSLSQLDSLKTNLSSLSAESLSVKSLTDKISGVAVPDFANGEFGFQQVASVTTSYEGISQQIPTSLDKTYNMKSAIGGHLDNITAPLNLAPSMTSTKSSVDSLIVDLQTGKVSIANANSQYSSATSMYAAQRTTSISTMNTFMEGSKAMSYVSTVAGIVGASSTGAIPRANSFVNQVVQPTKIAQIQDGIALMNATQITQ